MFEDILNEIKTAEKQAKDSIKGAQEERVERIKKTKDQFEHEIGELTNYEKDLMHKLFADETETGEKECEKVSQDYAKIIHELKENSNGKMEQALNKLMEGLI